VRHTRGSPALRDRYPRVIRARFPAIPHRVLGYDLPALVPGGGSNEWTKIDAGCYTTPREVLGMFPTGCAHDPNEVIEAIGHCVSAHRGED